METAYEAMFIVPSTLDEERVQALLGRFKRLIEENGGVVEEARVWEKRRLAYELRNLREGLYLLIRFRGRPTIPTELNRVFRLTEEVLRGRVFHWENAPAPAAASKEA